MLISIILACTDPGKPDPAGDSGSGGLDSADSGDTSGGDSGATDDTGDTGDSHTGTTVPEVFSAPEVTLGALPTMLEVRWTTTYAGIAWIEWEEDGDAKSFAHQTRESLTPATAHEFLLAGLPPSATGRWRLALRDEAGAVVYSDAIPFATAGLPPLPEMLVKQVSEELDGYFLMPSEDSLTMVLFDRKGRAVWYYTSTNPGFLSRTHYRDGAIWYNHWIKDRTDAGTVEVIDESLGRKGTYDAFGSHHDFWVDSEGLALIVQDRRTGPDGEIWTGDRLTWQPWGGAAVDLWNSWDHVTQSGSTGENFFPGTVDWMHCNGLDREGDLFVMSCKAQGAVFAIGMDGSTPWTLGGQDGTVGVPVELDLLHGPNLDGDRLWLFSNTTLPGQPGPEGLGFDLDPSRATSTIGARYAFPQANAPHFGSVVLPGDGRVMVSSGWGEILSELNADMTERAVYDLPFEGAYFDYVPHFGGPLNTSMIP